MKTLITEKLLSIEKDHHIKILYACESGSRGWGFPSPDSDFDVRFIYLRPYRYYLSVMEKRSDLYFPIDDTLDMYGWDLRKTLQLIRKSNTTPFEWLQSPETYMQTAGFRDSLLELCQHFFSQRSNIHHYLGIAKGAMDTANEQREIGIKKLFYVLRPLLAAKWCLEKNEIAPMEIAPLMELLPADLKYEISNLIQLKAGLDEGQILTISDKLNRFINDEFESISTASGLLERTQFGTEKLDDYFIKTILRYDH